MSFRILGTGKCVPSYVMTNDEMATIVDTSDEWIRTRSGIRERRVCTTESLSDLTIEASKLALEDAGVSPEELDLIICATFRGEYCSPAQACIVQKRIGANCPAFDVNAACSGFIYSLDIAAGFFVRKTVKKVLVVAADNVTNSVDWEDRSTCVLFGDGAGAAVLKAEETGVVDMLMGSDGTKGPILSCTSRTLGNFLTGTRPELGLMTMDGQEVFRFAVKKVPESIEILLERNHISREEIKYYVLHQANERIVEAAARRLKEPMEKFPMTISKYGNTSSASIPLLLNDMAEKNMLQPGDKIILSGFGAGMTWGAVLMEW